MHVELCFCADLIPQHTATQILILMQWGERHCVTNTAHLLPKCLSNSEIRYRGNPDRSPVQIEDLLTRPNTFVLFPSPSAIVLDEKFKNALTSPATLVALDGNWGQASSMMRREEVFQKLPKVILAPGPKSAPLKLWLEQWDSWNRPNCKCDSKAFFTKWCRVLYGCAGSFAETKWFEYCF